MVIGRIQDDPDPRFPVTTMGLIGDTDSDRTRFDPGGVNIPSTDPDPTSGDGGSSTPTSGLNIPTFAGTDRAGQSGRETTAIGLDAPVLNQALPDSVSGDGGLDLGMLALIGAATFAVIALLEG